MNHLSLHNIIRHSVTLLILIFFGIATAPAQTLPTSQPAQVASPDAGPQTPSRSGLRQPAPPVLPSSTPPTPERLALAPSIIITAGREGQSVTQTLRISNQTRRELSFEMQAEDVVVADGARGFLPAGETPRGIAATAVFSPKEITVNPGGVGVVNVTLTVPAQTPVRAVVAMFHGTDKIANSKGMSMTASLGTLVTFSLSHDYQISAVPVEVSPQTSTKNIAVSTWLTNTGTDPVVPRGAAVVLNAQGALMGKGSFDPQRLLPGERLLFKADCPSELKPGTYHALATFLVESKTLTYGADFTIP